MDGSNALIEQLVKATGLPESTLHKVLDRLFQEPRLDKKKATLEEVRFIMTNYMLNVFSEMSNESEAPPVNSLPTSRGTF